VKRSDIRDGHVYIDGKGNVRRVLSIRRETSCALPWVTYESVAVSKRNRQIRRGEVRDCRITVFTAWALKEEQS
jgi:hypothetical protein